MLPVILRPAAVVLFSISGLVGLAGLKFDSIHLLSNGPVVAVNPPLSEKEARLWSTVFNLRLDMLDPGSAVTSPGQAAQAAEGAFPSLFSPSSNPGVTLVAARYGIYHVARPCSAQGAAAQGLACAPTLDGRTVWVVSFDNVPMVAYGGHHPGQVVTVSAIAVVDDHTGGVLEVTEGRP